MHFSGTRGKIALFSLSLSHSWARSRAWERAREKVERPDLSKTTVRVGSLYPMDRQCAKGEKKKLRTRGGKRVSIIVGRPAPHSSFDHYRPSLRDRKADLDAKSYTYWRRIARACKGNTLPTRRGASNVRTDFTARCAPRKRGLFPFPTRGEKTRFARCSRRDGVFTQGAQILKSQKRFIYAKLFFFISTKGLKIISSRK